MEATAVSPEHPAHPASTGRRDRRRRAVLVAGTTLMLGAACAASTGPVVSGPGPGTTGGSVVAPVALTFYRPPTVLDSGAPGEVLSRAPITLATDLPATGERITYVSTTPAGDRVPVTGVLMRPLTPPPPGGYPVAVWGHGTTGLGDECAPSAFSPFSLAGAAPLLEDGVAVVAPDYEGLGTDELHPYLVGEASGRNVLDAARAASTVGGGRTVVAWGHSQGGHAVLFARMLAATYAPELDLRGVAAAAPVTDPRVFLAPGKSDPEVFPYTVEAIFAWATVYDQAELTDLVDEQAAEQSRLLVQTCTGDIAEAPTRPPEEIFLADPANDAVWNEAVRINTAGAGDGKVPVMLTHGDADTLVPIAGSVTLAGELCTAAVPTVLRRDPTWNHTTAWAVPLPEIDAWLLDRLHGAPAPSSCPPQPAGGSAAGSPTERS